jgi:hypothetical protein
MLVLKLVQIANEWLCMVKVWSCQISVYVNLGWILDSLGCALGSGKSWLNSANVSVNAGLDRARLEGKKLGRPTTINDSVINAVRLLRSKSLGIRKIATELKVGVGTVMKILNDPIYN